MALEQKESIDSVHEQFKKMGFCFRTGVIRTLKQIFVNSVHDNKKTIWSSPDLTYTNYVPVMLDAVILS